MLASSKVPFGSIRGTAYSLLHMNRAVRLSGIALQGRQAGKLLILQMTELDPNAIRAGVFEFRQQLTWQRLAGIVEHNAPPCSSARSPSKTALKRQGLKHHRPIMPIERSASEQHAEADVLARLSVAGCGPRAATPAS